MKPELRLFLTLNGIDTTFLNYMNIVDLHNPEKTSEEMETFLKENTKLDGVVECMEDQIKFVPNASVVICHLPPDAKKGILNLDSTKTRLFIIIGSKEQIIVNNPSNGVRIFNHEVKRPFLPKHNLPPSHYIIDFSLGYSALPCVEVKFIPPNPKEQDIPDQRAIYVPNPSRQIAKYTHFPVSMVVCNDGILDLAAVAGNPLTSTLLIVHGKPKPGGIHWNEPRKQNLNIVFVDMCDDEVKEVEGREPSLYAITNPKLLHPTFNTFARMYREGNVPSRLALESVLREKGISGDAVLQACYPFDRFDNILYRRKRDPLGFKKAIARIKDESVSDEGELRQAREKRKQLLHYESHLDTEKRNVLATRFETLRNSRTFPKAPYVAERVCIDSLIRYDIETHNEMETGKNLPMEPPMVFADIPSNSPEMIIKDQRKVLINIGENSSCCIRNCGLVIVRGKGILNVCGCIHSLVVNGSVSVRFDNVSPESFDPDVYLFIRGSNIFDAVGLWRDMDVEKLSSYRNETTGTGLPLRPFDEKSSRNRAIVRNFLYDSNTELIGIHTALIQKLYENV